MNNKGRYIKFALCEILIHYDKIVERKYVCYDKIKMLVLFWGVNFCYGIAFLIFELNFFVQNISQTKNVCQYNSH